MKIVSVILARGGSKGIPRKNTYPVNGCPLIGYAISTSIGARVDETWVSTEDKGVASIAKVFGAKILIRPDELAEDSSPSEDALLHFAENVDFDILVFIQPTSPLLLPRHIDEGLDLMKDYDSVFSGYKEHWVPRWREYEMLSGKKTVFPDHWLLEKRMRRQDAKEKFVENGAFYITTRKKLLNSRLRYSGSIGCYDMKYSESFQVDTYDDIYIVEAMLKMRRK